LKINDPQQCDHQNLLNKETKASEQRLDFSKPHVEIICDSCGKTTAELYDNLNWFSPMHKHSQQPHGQQTLYCNACNMFVKPTSFGGEDDLCPYHQRQATDEDGVPYQMYDEFNQDGEEW